MSKQTQKKPPELTLSLCMLVKNEATNVQPCLASVRDIVSEMIVLDTGSSDRTPELAASLGARVYDYEWQDDFAAARNQALAYATGDWVLVLDADERLVDTVKGLITAAIQNPKGLVVNLLRQEVGATQSPYSLLSRLFRRHPAIHFSRPYHALIDDSVLQLLAQEPDWQVRQIPDIAILHEGYTATAIAQQNKFERARRSMERYWQQHPNDPYVCAKLGALYSEQGDFAKSQQCLQTGLQHCDPGDASVCYELHYAAGRLYTRFDQTAQAIDHYQQAIAQPLDPRLKLGSSLNLGNLYLAQGRVKAARSLYQTVVDVDPTLSLGYYNLAMSLNAQGDLRGAIAAYQKALAIDPNYANAHQNLGVVWYKVGQMHASFKAFQNAINLHIQQGRLQQAQQLQRALRDMNFRL